MPTVIFWSVTPCALLSVQKFSYSVLKMETGSASETVIPNYRALQCHNPRDHIIELPHCKDTTFIYFAVSLMF